MLVRGGEGESTGYEGEVRWASTWMRGDKGRDAGGRHLELLGTQRAGGCTRVCLVERRE